MGKWYGINGKKGADNMGVLTDQNVFNEKKEVSMQMLFSLLNESIDDYENGRIISEEEMLSELKSVETES